jgi:hypothetical protein
VTAASAVTDRRTLGGPRLASFTVLASRIALRRPAEQDSAGRRHMQVRGDHLVKRTYRPEAINEAVAATEHSVGRGVVALT